MHLSFADHPSSQSGRALNFFFVRVCVCLYYIVLTDWRISFPSSVLGLVGIVKNYL